MMNSRQRMLAALDRQEPDHVPCSFMLFNGLRSTCRDFQEFIERQVAMGLDAYVQLPPRPPAVVNDHYNLHGLPVSYDPRVRIREWKEQPEGEDCPVLVKEYCTPAGTLRAEVRQTGDWPWGDHVPFLDDYMVPRSRRFVVTGPEDLEALRFLLVPPTRQEAAACLRESAPALALAKQHGLLVVGGWGVGADLIGWVYGLDNLIYAVHDQPQFVADLLDIIAAWNRRRMEVALSADVDLYVKRAWYENLDFWTPSTWRRFLYPILKADIDLAHARGVKFGYIITSNCMRLLPMLAELGIDVIIGVDPRAWDLVTAKETLRGKVCLWGGVNGHLTVEHGSPEQVEAEVQESIRLLAPGGGFILSPVDNVREETPTARANVATLLAAWRRSITGQSLRQAGPG
jgi:uroporphyrinogen-III decarboxylase